MIRPDGSDPRNLRMFFEENSYLTTSELARLAGTSMEVIRSWRKKCGMTTTGNGWGSGLDKAPFQAPKLKRAAFKTPVSRALWDTHEWLTKTYVEEEKGIDLISRMTKCNRRLIWQRLRHHGITIRSHKQATGSRNSCCNRKWLIDHYEIEGLTLRRCAGLAGVSTYTIYRWLVKFNVHIRDLREAMMGDRNPCYGKHFKNGKHFKKTA